MRHSIAVSALCLALLSVPFTLSQIVTVGQVCTESTECGQGSYCASNKRCSCLTSYVEISGYCWRKVNPGEAGCSQNRQCSAVWPGSYCSRGECRCGNNQPPFPTLDGLICVNYGECPIGRQETKLRDANVDGEVIQCDYGNFLSPSGTLYPQSGNPTNSITAHVRPTECPETYDCICGHADCQKDDTNYDRVQDGFCCPSRAYTCTLQYDEGAFPSSGGGTVAKWHYDPITNECKQFQYRGARGNSNRFESKEHCESYCKQSCERGRPEYSETRESANQGQTDLGTPLPVTCNSGSTGSANCRNSFKCTTVGTRNYCCPSVDVVCSVTGGVAYPTLPANTPENENAAPTTENPYDPGIAPYDGAPTFSRFYYDRSSASCKPFTWLGQGGNFNNFLTESHCDLYCSKIVCTAGTPLKDSTGVTNVNCGGSDSQCPTTHECKSNVCCPRPQFVCKLSMSAGSCASYTTRWWYNAATGNCEEFTYSGCQGNSNNFDSYNDCQTFCKDTRVEPQCTQGKALKDSNQNYIVCGGTSGNIQTCPANYYCYYDKNTYGCCPTQAFTCEQSYDAGRKCGPTVTRWYYDSSARKCQTFTYNGCDGNSNNFATQQDCNEYCRIDMCPDGGNVLTGTNGAPRKCNADGDCPGTHYCSVVSLYTPNTLAFTLGQYCCPSKDYVCGLNKDSGTRCTKTTIPRYWFNQGSRSCEEFTYNGCAGNRNNFANKQQCENYCLSSACPVGQVVSSDNDSNRLSTCTVVGRSGTASDGCASQQTCYNSQLLNQNVCCGPPPGTENLCPVGSAPFVSALTLLPKQCTPNVIGTCPGGYFCWYSAQNNNVNAYYCCKEKTIGNTGICPPQLKPAPGRAGELYKGCAPDAGQNDAFRGCGFNEACQFSERLGQYICCTSATDLKPNVCPPQPLGTEPYFSGTDYRRCDPYAIAGTSADCPNDAACLYITVKIGFICCRQPGRNNARLRALGLLGSGGATDASAQGQANGVEYRGLPNETGVSHRKAEANPDECGNALGFYRVAGSADSVACSPHDPKSCSRFERGEVSLTKCMHNGKTGGFNCCSSLWRMSDAAESVIDGGEEEFQ